MHKTAIFVLSSIFIALVPFVSVEAIVSESTAYRNVVSVPVSNIMVPTVVELPLSGERLERPSFLVVENETEKIIASSYEERYAILPTPIEYSVPSLSEDTDVLNDNDFTTFVRFELNPEAVSQVQIIASAPEVISVSGFTLSLAPNVALPTTVEVQAVALDGASKIVLARSDMQREQVRFVATSANQFVITLTYAQPLQVSEISLIQDDPEKAVTRSVRFLAQPNASYQVYANPDRSISLPYVESGNLTGSDALLLPVAVLQENLDFVPADSDTDTIPDIVDNCITVANPDQLDIDGNGRGDVCDDWDRDGVINSIDNCPNTPNRNQLDEDGDGIGDACDDTESRLTEQYQWVPWIGMGVAGIVVISLFVLVARRPLLVAVPGDEEV